MSERAAIEVSSRAIPRSPPRSDTRQPRPDQRSSRWGRGILEARLTASIETCDGVVPSATAAKSSQA
jgi:hypothetical protein